MGKKIKYVARTLYGLEEVLAAELTMLGASDIVKANRAVLFTGSMELMYRVNYCSRTAISVLMIISEFGIKSKDDLYRKAQETEWQSYMDVSDTFSIVPVINSGLFDHTGYPGLVLKDAIADYFRSKKGSRPSVDTSDPTLLINLHISNDRVTVSLDSSVVPLFKRGYRKAQGSAPLNEVLAAGILMLSGWDASVPLTDPMCGSGTIPIEARMIANRIPPGKYRSFFGFTRWKNYDESLYRMVQENAEEKIIESPILISGSDISEEAVRQSITNVSNAGLADQISIESADFRNIKSTAGGYLVFNPPYGHRVKPEEINDFYKMVGTTLKHNFAGNKAWIITSSAEFLHHIGLKPKTRITLYNGAIECLLTGYEIYEGTRKNRRSEI